MAVWQAVCIVLVVSIQFSVESGCTAIKQLLSLNAAIFSGPKNLSFAVSSTGRLQRPEWKLQVLPAVLPVILPVSMSPPCSNSYALKILLGNREPAAPRWTCEDTWDQGEVAQEPFPPAVPCSALSCVEQH